MENVITEISSQNSPTIAPASKMTYEEFLREYDEKYAEYVGGEIIRDVTVSKTHDWLWQETLPNLIDILKEWKLI